MRDARCKTRDERWEMGEECPRVRQPFALAKLKYLISTKLEIRRDAESLTARKRNESKQGLASRRFSRSSCVFEFYKVIKYLLFTREGCRTRVARMICFTGRLMARLWTRPRIFRVGSGSAFFFFYYDPPCYAPTTFSKYPWKSDWSLAALLTRLRGARRTDFAAKPTSNDRSSRDCIVLYLLLHFFVRLCLLFFSFF